MLPLGDHSFRHLSVCLWENHRSSLSPPVLSCVFLLGMWSNNSMHLWFSFPLYGLNAKHTGPKHGLRWTSKGRLGARSGQTFSWRWVLSEAETCGNCISPPIVNHLLPTSITFTQSSQYGLALIENPVLLVWYEMAHKTQLCFSSVNGAKWGEIICIHSHTLTLFPCGCGEGCNDIRGGIILWLLLLKLSSFLVTFFVLSTADFYSFLRLYSFFYLSRFYFLEKCATLLLWL